MNASGEIGWFRIKSESAIAAGVRRIEAVTADRAIQFTQSALDELESIKAQFRNPGDVVRQVSDLVQAKKLLEKELAQLKSKEASSMKDELLEAFKPIGEIKFLGRHLGEMGPADAKSLAYDLGKTVNDAVILFATTQGEKVNLQLIIDKDLANDEFHAGKMIKEIARHIDGGGGGQAFYAASGGKNPKGVEKAIEELEAMLSSQ